MNATWEELAATHGAQGAAYTGARRTIDRQVPFTRRQPGETYREKERRLLDIGWHPTGVGRLLARQGGDPSATCAGCALLVRSPFGDASYRCRAMELRWQPGRSTRCLRAWPACERYREEEPDVRG